MFSNNFLQCCSWCAHASAHVSAHAIAHASAHVSGAHASAHPSAHASGAHASGAHVSAHGSVFHGCCILLVHWYYIVCGYCIVHGWCVSGMRYSFGHTKTAREEKSKDKRGGVVKDGEGWLELCVIRPKGWNEQSRQRRK